MATLSSSRRNTTIPADANADTERAKSLFFEALDLSDARDHVGAEARLRAALALVPDRPSILTNLAATLFNQNKIDEALVFAQKALAINPDSAEAMLVVGNSLVRHRRMDEAIAVLRRIVATAPNDAEAWAALATALAQMNRHEEAVPAYRNAQRAQPDFEYVRGDLIHALMYIGDWTDLEADWADLARDIRDGKPVARPFQTLSMPVTAADQLACARLWCVREVPEREPIWRGERYRHDRIRVAYVCADFGRHPISQVMVGLFEQHDRARFETIAVATEPSDGSAMRQRVVRAFDRFIEAGDKSDREIAELLRALEVDIAIDLNGHTTNARTAAFAFRPSPIQVSYIAFPGTMGAGYIDYLIADPIVVPESDRMYYAEKIVWLPESYYLNDDACPMPETAPPRNAEGLPEAGFVFCCFNNSYKITPDVFDVWMRLLRAVDGSVLWLLESNGTFSANLRREAEARGIPPERVVFAPRLSLEEHLARHRLADLFLDTFHYNAHTTACDALWMGLPVLTRIGSTFASRVGASLLNAIGLPELVTATTEDYERRALELARTPPLLDQLKAKLAANRLTRPLFDTRRSARHVEAAYVEMVERHARGALPRDLTIAAID